MTMQIHKTGWASKLVNLIKFMKLYCYYRVVKNKQKTFDDFSD